MSLAMKSVLGNVLVESGGPGRRRRSIARKIYVTLVLTVAFVNVNPAAPCQRHKLQILWATL